MSWMDYDPDEELGAYGRFLKQQALEAMNDREVGLLGQCQAAKDYDDLSHGRWPSPPSCHVDLSSEVKEPVKESEDEESTRFGLPIISW